GTAGAPGGLQDGRADVDGATPELTRELQSPPWVAQIADRREIDINEVLEVLEANHNRRPLSLDRPAGTDDTEEAAAPSEWIGGGGEGVERGEGRDALDAGPPHLCPRRALLARGALRRNTTPTSNPRPC